MVVPRCWTLFNSHSGFSRGYILEGIEKLLLSGFERSTFNILMIGRITELLITKLPSLFGEYGKKGS